ncbi:MAG: STAS domain-containing protein [Phycisphaeraceae bacterium]
MSVKVVAIDDDGVATLACAGEMNALEMTTQGKGLKGVLGDDWASRNVALDLSEASYMDSAAIGWLLSLHKAFSDAGGRLILFGTHPNVRRVIEMMRIDKVLDLAEDREHALKRLRGEH